MTLLLRLQILQGIAHAGGLLVVLAGNGFLEGLLQPLPLGKLLGWFGLGLVFALLAVVAEVFQPLLQRGDLARLVGQFRAFEGDVKVENRLVERDGSSP